MRNVDEDRPQPSEFGHAKYQMPRKQVEVLRIECTGRWEWRLGKNQPAFVQNASDTHEQIQRTLDVFKDMPEEYSAGSRPLPFQPR